jgi:hypothetical protein
VTTQAHTGTPAALTRDLERRSQARHRQPTPEPARPARATEGHMKTEALIALAKIRRRGGRGIAQPLAAMPGLTGDLVLPGHSCRTGVSL